MTPRDLSAGADLDALGAAVNVPRVVMIPPRAGMTVSATAAALGKSLDALLDDLADAACGEYERLRTTANTFALTPLQWRTLLRVSRFPRPRRSRQVRGQRARCAARVAARDAFRP